MDIISQLQEQVNQIAGIAFNTFGTLQRDAPPVRLSPNYPDPPANPTEDTANFAEQPKLMSAALVKAAKQVCVLLGLSICLASIDYNGFSIVETSYLFSLDVAGAQFVDYYMSVL